VNQTWADLRREFERSQCKQRIISSTAIGAGYHTPNVAEYYVQSQLPAYGGFFTVVANLTNATSSDRETVDTLTRAIATLTDQLAAKDMWAKSKEAESKHLLGGRTQMWPLLLLDPLVPTSVSLTRPITTTNEAAPRKLQVTRMKQPRTISWGATLEVVSSSNVVGKFR
jgi:hypothetical protein